MLVSIGGFTGLSYSPTIWESFNKAIGIVARGYAYRSFNAKVIGIANDESVIGVALVKDMDDSYPDCLNLMYHFITR